MKSAKSSRFSGGRLPEPGRSPVRRCVDTDDELQAGALGIGGDVEGVAGEWRVVPLVSALVGL